MFTQPSMELYPIIYLLWNGTNLSFKNAESMPVKSYFYASAYWGFGGYQMVLAGRSWVVVVFFPATLCSWWDLSFLTRN